MNTQALYKCPTCPRDAIRRSQEWGEDVGPTKELFCVDCNALRDFRRVDLTPVIEASKASLEMQTATKNIQTAVACLGFASVLLGCGLRPFRGEQRRFESSQGVQ